MNMTKSVLLPNTETLVSNFEKKHRINDRMWITLQDREREYSYARHDRIGSSKMVGDSHKAYAGTIGRKEKAATGRHVILERPRIDGRRRKTSTDTLSFAMDRSAWRWSTYRST